MSKHSFKYSTPKQYTIGFVLSVVLTVLAFISINWDYSTYSIIFILMVLAITQLFVQLVFFLHMNKEQYPRWNLMMLLLAAWFVIAIVLGSIWIMDNLNYNMSPDEVDKQLIEDEGYKP